MEHKRLAVQLKGDSAGAFRAIFATFNQVDHDGDVTLPGAFPVGAKIPIAGVGHNWDVPTIGNGTIGADREKAWLDGRFNLKMDAGRETCESIKFDADEGVNAQQYSYAYDVRPVNGRAVGGGPVAGGNRRAGGSGVWPL